ncbi:MAG: endonuclease/exonuclease/phosphatase family protein [Solirubrobacterales bacterium]
MEVRALSWNLFHGRDHPPEPELLTWRSRLLGGTVRGDSHAQVNTDLAAQFESVLAAAEWDVALLQECPPRWAERLATACGAAPHLVPTSRNIPGAGHIQALLADRNPDLIASWEGGSNLTLVRLAGPIAERRHLRLTSRPERRVMAFSRLPSGICVANLHASAERERAERELILAARVAREWSGPTPLLLGGDFNLRPALSPHVFQRLEGEFGLRAPTGERVIDHLLVTGLEIVEPPRQWAPELREVPDPTAAADRVAALPIRLSDHAPVAARFATPAMQSPAQ